MRAQVRERRDGFQQRRAAVVIMQGNAKGERVRDDQIFRRG